MSNKSKITHNVSQAPENLKGHIFYGMELNEEQTAYRNAIWNKDKLIVFSNSCSGSGKTTVAVATAKMLVESGRYEQAYFIVSPCANQINGFLGGSLIEKEMPYYAPLFDALVAINEMPKNMFDEKLNYWIQPTSHVYMRGINFQNSVIIIDEAQNFYTDELKKVLTRCHDTCKVIVIGHSQQCDLFRKPQNSGFVKYLNHFKDEDYCAVCNLTVNYRGLISKHADELI